MNSRNLRDPAASAPRWQRRTACIIAFLPIVVLIAWASIREAWLTFRLEWRLEMAAFKRNWR
jgi:hypothetical protein